MLGLAMSGYMWPFAFNLVYLHLIFFSFGLVYSLIMYFCVFLKVDFVESSATSPPRVIFVPSFLYFTMEQAWEDTAFSFFLYWFSFLGSCFLEVDLERVNYASLFQIWGCLFLSWSLSFAIELEDVGEFAIELRMC